MAETPQAEGSSSSDVERFRAAYAKGERNFARWSLAGADLHGMDLHGANFFHADLREANLEGADLSRVNFGHADLTSANLRGTNIINAYLDGARLDGADMSGAAAGPPAARPGAPSGGLVPGIPGSIRFCVYCGTTLSADARFCATCGQAQPQIAGQPVVLIVAPLSPSGAPSASDKARLVVAAVGYGVAILGAAWVLYAFFLLPDVFIGTPSSPPDFFGHVTQGCSVAPSVPCNQTLTGVGSTSVDAFAWILPILAAIIIFGPAYPGRKKRAQQGVALLLLCTLGSAFVLFQPNIIHWLYSRISLGGNFYVDGPSVRVSLVGNPPPMIIGWAIVAVGGLVLALSQAGT